MSINNCVISGNIAYISAIKRSANGETYIKAFMQATNRIYDKTEGDYINRAEFIPIVAIGSAARVLEKINIGRKAVISCSLHQFFDENKRAQQVMLLVDKDSDIVLCQMTKQQVERSWHSSMWF